MKWRRAVLPRARTGSVAITSPLQTSMEGAFLGLFPGPVVECNVEPAVLRDVYASYVSIPGPWYRGDRRRRSRGTSGTRRNSWWTVVHQNGKGVKRY